LVYLSGPVLHLILALLFRWGYLSIPSSGTNAAPWLFDMADGVLHYGFIVSMLLFILNLLPFYPMDGWYVLRHATGTGLDDREPVLRRIGIALLIGFMIVPFGQVTLTRLYMWVSGLIIHSYG
jgi:Zn-dependent protease